MSVEASPEAVLHEVRDGVALLTLNRPGRLNAWTPSMEARYFGLLETCAEDPAVRVIVVTINGACAGLGLVQALMCDLRFAAAGAKFTTAFVRRGLVAEHGSSWILPRLIGPARALDLLLSGRVFLADEALSLGLVNRVVEGDRLLATAMDYAKDVAANCSPTAL